MSAAADKPGRDPDSGTDPALLAERRARRAELAEGELRSRLADAEQRVAQLEHGAHESGLLRERLAARAERDARMAALVADAAATLRAAREALDREIAARGVAEAALHAERAAREAAERAVVAERAARDAATSALTAERARVTPVPVTAPVPAPAPETGAPPTVPAQLLPPADAGPEPAAPDNEQLIAGLALAAERLRAQTPVDEDTPEPRPVAALPSAPAPQAVEPEPAADAEEPWAPRPGGLLERVAPALTRRR
ncbi:MAG TPA: hypothetical protein PKD63_08555 [Solirubrobacteraceae bacterium]|nr:hypothetical protein [Solirubrobacteraceae bacterium]